MAASARQLVCVLVADDLTGACDSAVHFAAAGFRTCVPLIADAAPAEAEVVAWSTGSRDLEPAEAACRVRQLAVRIRNQEPRILFKKIDSTLRGNSGEEIVAALDAFACEAAVITPAFPAMGRMVRGGALVVARTAGFQQIELPAWLRAHGAEACCHVAAGAVAAAIDSGARYVTVDATCDEDLADIATEIAAIGRRILWVGSGGLAGALARHLAIQGEAPEAIARGCGPVLFCIGSDHPVTVEQQRRLAAERGIEALPVARNMTADALRGRLPKCPPGALFVSGGDTASLVCAALGARWIEPRREYAPGIPEGILRGGAWDGVTLLTKSGGFGAPDDLVRMADYFHV